MACRQTKSSRSGHKSICDESLFKTNLTDEIIAGRCYLTSSTIA
jgi:hypothetical protein